MTFWSGVEQAQLLRFRLCLANCPFQASRTVRGSGTEAQRWFLFPHSGRHLAAVDPEVQDIQKNVSPAGQAPNVVCALPRLGGCQHFP